MRVWKLVSGILSIIFSLIVSLQSCAVGLYNALDNSNDAGGAFGIILGVLMLTGGIVSIAVRNNKGIGGNIAVLILFGIAAFSGLTPSLTGTIYSDLIVWTCWCGLCAVLAFINLFTKKA